MKKSKDRTKTKDWQKADARILGQILAAQNIEFVLPDSTRIAEFFAETLTAIPGIAGCRVCFYEVSVLRGGMETGICQECEASRRKTETHEMISSFEPGFICKLAGQSGMHFNAIASPSHHFGFFIFQVNDLDAFNIYRPFIDNLANYVALSLENRQQRDLLQKAHDELEHKVAERTEELRASNEVIKDLYNNAPCGYHSLDKDGFIILINDTELRWLGYSRAEIIRKVAFRDLLTVNSLKLFEKNFPTFKERGWVSDLEFEMVCKNGDILPVLLNATAITDSNGNYVMSRSTIFDITERKRAENALQQRELHSQSLLRLSRSLEHSQTYTEALNAARDEVKAVIGYQNLWAYLLTEDRKYFKAFIAGGTLEEVVMSEDGAATLAISGDRMLEEIAEAREIVIVEDAPTDERTDKDIVASLGNHTIVNIPIIVFDKHLGTIGTGTFGDEGVRVPTKTEQEYLLALASHMAVALDRIHLLEKRKQMEQELVTREREYRILVENIPDLIVRYNTELRRIYVNPAWEKASGSPARDVLNVIPADVPGGPRPANNEYVEKLQHVLKTGIPQTIEFTWINAYEKALLLECFIVPEYDQYGIINGVLSVGRDITERKRNERELITLNHAINQSSDAVFLINEKLTFAYVNDAACRSLGYTREELLTMGPSDIDAVITHDQAEAIMSKQFAIGSFPRFETRHKTRDGRTFPVEVSSSVVEYDGTKLSLTTVHDITERKRAEENLRISEEKYRALAENIPNVVYQCKNDSRYTFVYLNNAIEKLTGYTREDFLEKGLSFFNLYHPDDLKTIPTPEENNITDINRNPFHITYRIRHKSGEWRWVDEWGTGITDSNGKVEYLEGIMADITERKQHEREREAIISVSTELRQAGTKTGILNIILDQLVKLFEVDGAVLVLPNAQNGGFIDEMGRGVVGERMTGLVIPAGKGVCNWVITNKTPYLNNHADQDPLFYRPDLLGDSRCVACAPLLAQEQSIGALWLTRRMDFAEQDIHLLTAIADIAANAIHRVMLHEQTELQLHHLTALHQIDIAISRNFDSNLTLNVILNNVKNELKSDAADILLLDPITHTLDFVAGIGFRTRGIEQSHVKLADGYAGTAAREYRTVSCPDLKLARASFSRSSLLADEEFTTHFATPLIVKGQVKGVLELFHRKAFEPESGWIDYFETLATQAAIAIENASLLDNLQRSNAELILAYDATIEGWSRAMDLRDKETEGHTQRVTEMALELANMMGISDVEKQHLWRGSLLHDIGKMGVPDSILFKPGPLSEAEKQIMRQHPLYAYQMLSPITYLKPALDICYCHHERWDGSGYPRGLKGEEIPLSARLFAIVDVFDALTSDRPYRAAWPREDVYRYIQEQAGKHFDPQIVKIVLDHRMW
jgi:PAS domain S-box-containing protein